MTEAQKALPKWILAVSVLFALMEIMVSLTICFSPESVLEMVDLSAKGVDYLVYLWASRQFALGVIFAYATYQRSRPMLTVAYVFFLVMFLGDFFIGIAQGDNGLIVSALAMCMVSAALLYVITKRS